MGSRFEYYIFIFWIASFSVFSTVEPLGFCIWVFFRFGIFRSLWVWCIKSRLQFLICWKRLFSHFIDVRIQLEAVLFGKQRFFGRIVQYQAFLDKVACSLLTEWKRCMLLLKVVIFKFLHSKKSIQSLI